MDIQNTTKKAIIQSFRYLVVSYGVDVVCNVVSSGVDVVGNVVSGGVDVADVASNIFGDIVDIIDIVDVVEVF